MHSVRTRPAKRGERQMSGIVAIGLSAMVVALSTPPTFPQDDTDGRVYVNRLVRLEDPAPLLRDYPEFVQPIEEVTRFEAPVLVNDREADLHVRAWRFSYNARGIIEMPNRLRAKHTAIIMVHPWGIDDGQGWNTPEPAGVADFCTPAKNRLAAKHTRTVINPFLRAMRDKVAYVMYSLPGSEDSIRKKLYRSLREAPSETDRRQAARQLAAKLGGFDYRGEPLPAELKLSPQTPVVDYFRQFPGLDAGPHYNNKHFWDQPIPVTKDVEVHPEDIVVYDAEGYEPLKQFLKANGVRHVLLTGYATDMCFCRTTAGYENLSRDFNVFLVGDATLATFPANKTPKYATNAHISFDHVNVLATRPGDLQYRFQRAPWLIGGRTTAEVIRQNIRLTTLALKSRVGIDNRGFRTPGGFRNGLMGREDLQKMLLQSGFTWVSSKYPSHANSRPREQPSAAVYTSIVAAQAEAQPFVYPTGLMEIPMSPISDIGAFRNGRWRLEWFLEAIRQAVEWTIQHNAVFDFLAHPSCLVAADPQFRALDLICDLVEQSRGRAKLVDLDQVAKHVAE